MNPTDAMREVWCEWPVRSPFRGAEPRACGRAGDGVHVRLCWQHRDAATAEVVNNLYETPDGSLSEILANWVRSTAPNDRDSDDTAAARARARTFAMHTLALLLEYYGAEEQLPTFLQGTLSPLVDRLVEDRMAATWGGVA